MGKYCPTRTFFDNGKRQSLIIIPSGLNFGRNVTFARLGRIIDANNKDFMQFRDPAMTTFTSMALIALVAPKSLGPVVNPVFLDNCTRWRFGCCHCLL